MPQTVDAGGGGGGGWGVEGSGGEIRYEQFVWLS